MYKKNHYLDNKQLFVCIAGKNNIAVDVLEYLINIIDSECIGIVCNETDTGKDGFQKSLRKHAIDLGIKEYSLEDIYPKKNLVFISLEYDKIVNPSKFDDARLYNIHFSLLPKYKGMYTSFWPIINGEEMTGVTLHKIDSGIDTGDIIAQSSFMINQMNCREVYLSYIDHGTRLVIAHLDELLSGNVLSKPQPVAESTYYSRKSVDFKNAQVDLNKTAEEISRQIRAFSFREYQLPVINNRKIIDYKFTNNKSCKKPGSICYEDIYGCIIATVDYDIILYYDRLEELIEACKIGDMETVKEVSSVNKHINSADINGETPLSVARTNSKTDIINYLLIHGAVL